MQVVPFATSAAVFDAVADGSVGAAMLPIENSLHGSVSEHYDLLLGSSIRIDHELSLRIRHNVIAAPGVRLEDVRTVLSHPVALSQCRAWTKSATQVKALPFYDTAGSVKHVVENNLRDVAGIAPALAAKQYGGEVLVPDIQDHAQNFTRFFLLRRIQDPKLTSLPAATKLSLGFTVEHRPGSLVRALQAFADAGANLTKIESRPIAGTPWEYVFYVDLCYEGEACADAAVAALSREASMVKELGRYAESVASS